MLTTCTYCDLGGPWQLPHNNLWNILSSGRYVTAYLTCYRTYNRICYITIKHVIYINCNWYIPLNITRYIRIKNIQQRWYITHWMCYITYYMTCWISVLKINVLQNTTFWMCYTRDNMLYKVVYILHIAYISIKNFNAPWRPSMKPLRATPAPFDESIDRGSAPPYSLFPRWRPSMKPLIATPVLFNETIDRDSGPTPSSLLLHVSFELCRCWQLLLLHVSLATVLQVEPSSNHLEQAMAETAKKKRLHKMFLNAEAVWRIVFIRLIGTMLTEEAVGSFVGALHSLPPRDAAEEPETLEVLRFQISECARAALKSAGIQSCVLLSRPNGPGLRA